MADTGLTLKIDADVADAIAQVEEFKKVVDSVRDARINFEVDTSQVTQATADVDAMKAATSDVHINVQVDGAAAAEADLAAVRAAEATVDKTVHIDVQVSGAPETEAAVTRAAAACQTFATDAQGVTTALGPAAQSMAAFATDSTGITQALGATSQTFAAFATDTQGVTQVLNTAGQGMATFMTDTQGVTTVMNTAAQGVTTLETGVQALEGGMLALESGVTTAEQGLQAFEGVVIDGETAVVGAEQGINDLAAGINLLVGAGLAAEDALRAMGSGAAAAGEGAAAAASSLGAMASGVQMGAMVLMMFTAAAGIAAVAAGALGTAVAALGVIAVGVFAGFGGAMLLAGAGITAMVAASMTGSKKMAGEFADLKKQFHSFIDSIAKPFEKVMTDMVGAVKKALPQIEAPLKTAFEQIAKVSQGAIAPIIKSIELLGQAFQRITTSLAPAFTSFFKNMPALMTAVLGPIEAMSKEFGGLADTVAQTAVPAFGHLMGSIGEFGKTLLSIGAQYLTPFEQQLDSLVQHATSMTEKLRSAIGPAMQTFTDLGNTVMDVIGNSSAKITEFSQTVSSNMAPIGGILQDIINIVMDLGKNFVDAFAKCKPAFDQLAQVIRENGPAITAVLTDVINAVVNLASVITSLISAGQKVVGFFDDFKYSVAKIDDALGTTTQSERDFMKAHEEAGQAAQAATPPINAAADATKAQGDAAKAAAPPTTEAAKALTDVGKQSQTAGDAIKNATPNVDASGKAFDGAGKPIDAAAQALQGVKAPADAAKQSMTELTRSVPPELTANLNSTAKAFTGLTTALTPLVAPLRQVDKGLLDAAKATPPLVAPLGQVVKNFQDLLKTLTPLIAPFTRFIAQFRLLMPLLIQAAPRIAQVVAQFRQLSTLLAQVAPRITQFVTQFRTFSTVLVQVRTGFTQFITQLTRLPQLVLQVTQAFAGLLQQIKDTAQQMVSTWTQAMADMTKATTDGMTNVTKAVTDGMAAARQAAIREAAAFVQVGKDIDQAIVVGLRAGKSKVIAAAVQVALAALRAAKAALGIASPSKEFITIGEAMGEGMAVGTQNSEAAVVDQMTATADVATTTFADEFGGQIVGKMGDVNWQDAVIDHVVTTGELLSTAGQVWGKNLANGMKMAFGDANVTAGGLASAATAQANTMLANMGLLGMAGSGAGVHDSHAAALDYKHLLGSVNTAPDVSGNFDFRTPTEKWLDQPNLYPNPTTGKLSEYPAYYAAKGGSNTRGDQVVKVYLDGGELRHVVKTEVVANNKALASSLGVQPR